MDRMLKAIANTRRRPSSVTASLAKGLCPAELPLSIQHLVRQYGQSATAVLQYRPPGSAFALEPEPSSSRPLEALCCGWWDAPSLRRALPEHAQEVVEKATEAVSRHRTQLVKEVRTATLPQQHKADVSLCPCHQSPGPLLVPLLTTGCLCCS